MVSFSEIVAFFSGNGFTDQEALQVSVQIAELADTNKIWVEGVAARLVKSGDFDKLDPQNKWQDEVVKVLSAGLTARERQCYFFCEIKGMKPSDVGKLLGVSASAVWKYMDNVKYKLIADKPLNITEEMLNQLSERNRECFILHEHSSMSYYRIGKELGIDHTAARQYIRKAKMQLHDLAMRGVGA